MVKKVRKCSKSVQTLIVGETNDNQQQNRRKEGKASHARTFTRTRTTGFLRRSSLCLRRFADLVDQLPLSAAALGTEGIKVLK